MPLQVAAVLLGLLAAGALWLEPERAHIVALAVLALLWAWTSTVYHIVHFAQINRAAIGLGVLFIVQAILFAVYAMQGRSLELSPSAPGRVWAWALILYALLLYPLLGIWSGHVYPAAPVFGVTPCPLVVCTFGMFLFSCQRAPWTLFAIPALWSVIGGVLARRLPGRALPVITVIAVVVNGLKPRLTPCPA